MNGGVQFHMRSAADPSQYRREKARSVIRRFIDYKNKCTGQEVTI